MELHYRAGTEADLPLLTAMNIRLRADESIDNVMSEEEVGRRMKEMLAGTYTALVFSDEAGHVVGYTLTDYARTPMYLRQLYVDPAFRRKGCGRSLMQLTLAHFHITEIDLEVMVWNDNARGFYEKIGCRERYRGLRYRPGN